MLGGRSSRAVTESVGAGGAPWGRGSTPGGLRSRTAIGPAAACVWAALGRVEVLRRGGLEGLFPWFVLGYAAVWGKAEQPPASKVESPRNRALRGHKAAADMDPVHCKACECQTAGSSHRLPPGPAAAIPFPLAPGELRVRDPWLLAGGHSHLGFGQIMGFLLGGTVLPPPP